MKGTETTKVFADKLFDLINEKKPKKHEEIANEIGVDKSSISKYINDNGEAGINSLVKIARYFNVSTDYLLGLSPNKISLTTEENRLIRSICDYTGLNENAVFNLNFRYANAKEFDDKAMFDFLNHILDFDKQGIFLFDKVGEIKSFLIKYTKALANNREKNIELLKSKITEADSNIEQLKEFLEVTACGGVKVMGEKLKNYTIVYGKYEAEKLFGYLLDEYIKDAEQEFKKELDIRWQL